MSITDETVNRKLVRELLKSAFISLTGVIIVSYSILFHPSQRTIKILFSVIFQISLASFHIKSFKRARKNPVRFSFIVYQGLSHCLAH